ncbi:MAG: hypothetical protein SynsKO_34530 [Synoicihabitans sp.]
MRYPLRLLVLVAGLLFVFAPLQAAKPKGWHDLGGTKIKGVPSDVIGPFALFRDGLKKGQRVVLRGLAEEDCRRFYQEITANGPPAKSLAEATGSITSHFEGRVRRVKEEKLVEADLRDQAEPEVLVVLYGHPHNGNSWRGLRNFTSVYWRFKRLLGDRIEFLFMGAANEPLEQTQIATSMYMPWLIGSAELGRKSRVLSDPARSKTTHVMAISRNGAPIISGNAEDLESTLKIIDQLSEVVALMNPENPRNWKDRAHYGAAIRPVVYANGSTKPELIGNPLRPAALRDYGVNQVDADLSLDATGKVTGVDLMPTASVPVKMVQPLKDALKRSAVFLPAMSGGAAVPGTFEYRLSVPAEDSVADADAAWLSGDKMQEVILNEWFVLRPINVTEDDFSGVAYTDQDGVMVMQAVEVSNAKFTRTEQMSAFSTNWFDAEGAASVKAVEGQPVVIDGVTLEWEKIEGEMGFIDLQKGLGDLEYTIGYAWVEFDVPQSLPAWLGIGSDDGLKIWHNGELVHDKWIRRNSLIDDDIVPLTLTKGRNTLLIKIQNAWGDWSFISRLRIKSR